MHPLAVEDLLHVRNAARSKADYYQKHLFLRVLCHALLPKDEAGMDTPQNSVTHLPRSSSPIPMGDSDDEDSMAKNEDDETMYGSLPASRFATKRSGTLTNTVKRRLSKMTDVESKVAPDVLPRYANATNAQTKTKVNHPRPYSFFVLHAAQNKDAQNKKLIRELKGGDRVNVKISPMCIFLFRDGL